MGLRERSTERLGRAFTLVEILIVVMILAILAAIVVPRYIDAADTAYASSLRHDLRFIRSQLQVYKAQHKNVAPGYPGGDPSASPTEQDFINQMTRPTSESGQVGEQNSSLYRFGPYMQTFPVNPINGSAGVLVLDNGAAFPAAPDEDSPYGWIYKPATLEFRAFVLGADDDGVLFYDY